LEQLHPIVKQQFARATAKDSGIVGVGVGVKWVNGKPTNAPAIVMFVEKKRSKSDVISKFSAEEIIPQSIGGIPTDVIEVGKIVKQEFTSKVRPIQPGFSAGQKDITAGTIGGFFIDRDQDPVALSNCHVFANEGRAKIKDLIYQPGPIDAGPIINVPFKGWISPVADLPCFGTLKKFVKLKSKNNLQDSAIAYIHEKVIQQSLINPIYPTINKALAGFGEASVNQNVQKCGRTTGYTTGRVIAIHASFTVGYDFGSAAFNDCIVMSGMSNGGDSGSLILDMDMNVVGLLFAGSPKVTIANPIKYPVEEYGLQLWNPAHARDVLELGDNTWRITTTNGKVTHNGNIITIAAKANQFCYLEHDISNFTEITVNVNTGTDKGATWGPGLVVQWPNGMIKVNLRHGGSFGGYFNSSENISLGSTKPNTDYTLRVRKDNNIITGDVLDHGTWYTVIQVPTSIFPSAPTVIKVGKTCVLGGSLDYQDAGDDGFCTFNNLMIR